MTAFARAIALGLALSLTVACGSDGFTPGTGTRRDRQNHVAANQATKADRTEVAGQQLDRGATIAVSPYERQAFLELALEAPVALPRRAPVLGRWNRDPSFRVTGDPTPQDLRTIAESAQRWGLITGLEITVTTGPGDVDIHFVHRASFASVLRTDHVDSSAVGLTRIHFESGRRGTIDGGIIVIADDDIQVGRNRTIAHEFGHALGLQHSTCRSSLMDGSSDGDRSVRWSPSVFDARMASLLYDPRLEPGLDLESVSRRLVASATDGATCVPVDVELVRAAGSGRHYLCAKGPQHDRPCTADLSREPTLPIVNPDAWTDGASLTGRPPR